MLNERFLLTDNQETRPLPKHINKRCKMAAWGTIGIGILITLAGFGGDDGADENKTGPSPREKCFFAGLVLTAIGGFFNLLLSDCYQQRAHRSSFFRAPRTGPSRTINQELPRNTV
jgi:hypothetical protein